MLRQAQHERDGLVRDLVCHPDTPSNTVSSVSAHWCANDENEVLLTFVVTGAANLAVPGWVSPARADGLWQSTCFEMFWRPAGETEYFEVNLSPSSQWAAYAFDDYRAGMREHPMAVAPHVETSFDADCFALEADVDFATFTGSTAHIALSAVIEETDGTKSYWALCHPPGAPDFHHPDCFALFIPAVGTS